MRKEPRLYTGGADDFCHRCTPNGTGSSFTFTA